ncbi:MAG: DUF192 domain-containing protein [Nostocales cyanobacterium]|nr:MAG: DUF192 domain-containing protein [Nostocales cyanobacterium]TAF12335.1 MAG: DUF192 domain-containing protein [Nostocales cyanobacterium]
MRTSTLLCLILSFLLICCSPASTASDTSVNPTTTSTHRGQNLPISAQAILPQGEKINLEVAETPQQQMMGLMYRPALPDDRGMLFVFPSAQPVRFWMKNVPVALDMVFLHEGEIKYIENSAPGCQKEPCPTYGPNVPIDQVIELRAERAKELNLQVGDRISIKFLNSN